MWEYTKSIVISIFSAIFAYLQPVSGNIESLLVLLLLNFFVGLATGYIRQNESFELKKAFWAFFWAAIICVIVCCSYVIGERNGQRDETLLVIQWVCVIAIWAFGTNVLRNLKRLSKGFEPYHHFFCVIYDIASIEFIKRIPILKQINDKNYEHED